MSRIYNIINKNLIDASNTDRVILVCIIVIKENKVSRMNHSKAISKVETFLHTPTMFSYYTIVDAAMVLLYEKETIDKRRRKWLIDARMGKNFDKFLLLMWKNFLLQWRHPVQTLVEILAPVLFASLMVVLRSLVHPEQQAAVFFRPFENQMPNLTSAGLLRTVAWSPQHPILEKIMDDTVASIKQTNNISSFRHRGFNNSYELDEYLDNEINIAVTLAGIKFDNKIAEQDELPTKLDITFRFPGELRHTLNKINSDWKTNLLFPSYQTPGPRDPHLNDGGLPSYHREGFLMLQQELSLSIIDYLKQEQLGEPFDRNSVKIQMQRFPYPKYTEDILITALQVFVGLIFMVSFVYTCISTVKVITAEKEKQLKEAMKIMGLPNWLHWTAWFIKSFTFLVITITIMVILLKAKWYPGTEYTIFTYSNPFIIFLFLILYICATITFCFCISVFFSKANTAAAIAGLAWFLSYFPYSYFYGKYYSMSLGLKLAVSLCSNTAMAYGFSLLIMFEGNEEGLQWHNIWKTVTPDDNLKLGHVMIMLVADALIYLIIALYVEAVFPGEFGVPKPWYFPLSPSFWCGRSNFKGGEIFIEGPIQNEFYEKEPSHLDAGIRIQRLKKVFSNKKVAVRDLTLNMYRDQITVLLGHNGAGKTTTMSMLTGMFPPTSGTAVVGGSDIRSNIQGVRQSLGLCPQHNILFDELTVKEHLYFYSRLKGCNKKEVKEEIEKYVKLLDLQPKADALSDTLSGGMKRKLSVGVALCGNSGIVMLDEPTAGMDPSARRVLWDFLQSQKKGRTILLSTHFMDEADLLGDRIAIMAGGKLECCGSSFFLKKKYGAGYHLIMDKSLQCNVNEVTTLLQNYIPNIQVESNIGSELTYLLNEEYLPTFETMLGELELRSENLGILSYGISLTTLEEVFMKVGADHGQEEMNNAEEQDSKVCAYENPNFESTEDNVKHLAILHGLNGQTTPLETKLDLEGDLLSGWKLWRNQLMAMFIKRGLSVLRSWILLLIQIMIPVVFLALAILITSDAIGFHHLPNFKIRLDSYYKSVTTLTQKEGVQYAEKYIEFLRNDSKQVIDWGNASYAEKIIQETMKNTSAVRSRYVVGASFKRSIDRKELITAWFNNQPYHTAPLSLQMVLNSILSKEVPSNHSLQFFNHPLPFTLDTEFRRLSQISNAGFQIAFNVGFSMAIVSSFYLLFYVRERISKAKHLQFVSGVGVISFWVPSFLCDILTFLFTSLCVVVTIFFFKQDGFSTVEELGRLFIVLLYFGFAMLPMMYIASYFFTVPSTGFVRMTLINIFTGVAAFLVIQVLSTPDLELQHVAKVLDWIFLIVPHYSLSSGIQNINMLYSTHRVCDVMIDKCVHPNIPGMPNITVPPMLCKAFVCSVIQKQCCTITRNYYSLETPGIGRNVVFSCGVGVLLIGILLMIEFRVLEYIQHIFQKLRQYSLVPTTTDEEDSDVLQEKQKITNLTMEDISTYRLVIRNVTKYYGKFLAVNNLCLGVNNGECFGLLGVNGAGKTTTFKMMTGDIKVSSGEAWVNGFSLKKDMKQINQLIGYCPQFDALLDDLTCRETLIIFGLLRGISRNESSFMAGKLALQFDFQRHLNKKVKELSGGNKRKLSTAIALIGDPLVVYLDEPTTGMDPATKRYLWNALCKVRDSGKCIILTSHSMEECEALCTRLAIMVNGTFKCLGSTQKLKSKFSEGYTLTIKIQKEEMHGDTEMEAVEKFVKSNFQSARVQEKHQELITFYIADKSLPWSRMFGIMENGKTTLHIEDYSLGQSSLEQVFLTFTKHQRED